MNPTYTYTSSIDYINNLSFDYFETYSLQRGIEFEQFLTSSKPEYEKLKLRREKRKDLNAVEESRFLVLQELLGHTQYLINDKGAFHPSAKKIATFKSIDLEADELKEILTTEIKEVPSWLCAPLYRDAIVFYNNAGHIISTLNICLSCQYMETTMFNHVRGDHLTYDLLKSFFLRVGHKVEDPDYSIIDNWNKLKAKYEKPNT